MPSRAPNLSVISQTSPTSLLLQWDPVPQEYQHGILTGYTVRYKAIEEGAGVKIENSGWSTRRAPAHYTKLEIPNLASYTRYQLSMYAETKVGGGMLSNTVFGGMSYSYEVLVVVYLVIPFLEVCHIVIKFWRWWYT